MPRLLKTTPDCRKLPSLPLCEPLEARQLLSAKLVDGVLEVKGTAATSGTGGSTGADVISISKKRSTVTVKIGSASFPFPAGAVDLIRIKALDGNDTITASTKLQIPLLVYGGAGNDTITAGHGDDTLDGGDGTDSITGRAGADRIRGGTGNDTLNGSDDNDTIDGEAGTDLIHGGNGADLIRGGADNDSLFGDNNNDQLFGGSGNDSIDGGNDDDILDGGTDNDTLFDHSGSDILRGQGGNDSLDSADGVRGDGLNGGTGTNTVTADTTDFNSPTV